MSSWIALARGAALASTALSAATVLAVPARAAPLFSAGDLVVSYSVYQGTASTIAVGQTLPNSNGATAVANGSYPTVFNSANADGNFGIALLGVGLAGVLVSRRRAARAA